MRVFFALLLLCPVFLFAQKNKGYSSIGIGLNLGNNTQAYGVHFSGNAQLAPGSFFGIEAGVMKFKYISEPYIPLLGKITIAPDIDKHKLSPLIVLSPGYGIYSHRVYSITTRGGFDFYGGIGVVTASKTKGRAFITIGYSRYGFTIEDIKSKIEMVGIRTGVMFK